ncbi:MAG: LpxL/LpxP family Kdo(2)-lipid IV(A) lauroyl/palmitoleoyl acyltransferase [Pseudomonadales bacterium]|nr:LpxL/LpxP family Kdo(2)-lipid IV(A) lauroyl/palmitoleoyl acyltransferase [Pseudomonadales bacterium]
MTSKDSDSLLPLLAPRHWPMWLVIGLLRIVAFFPYSWMIATGKKLGRLLMKVGGSRVLVARRNLELCFPEKSVSEREGILERNFESLGITLLESSIAWWGGEKKIHELVEIEGLDMLKQRAADGKRTLVVAFHFMPFELCGLRIACDLRLSALYQPQTNEVFERVSTRRRNLYDIELIPRKKIKYMLSLLEKGELVGLLPDQDFGVKRGIFVPFFGIQAATVPSVSEYARQAKADVVHLDFHRKADFSGYKVTFSEPLENFPSGDDYADTLRLNQIAEQAIRITPDQYLWQHRRFKTRPEGEEPLYSKKERKK